MALSFKQQIFAVEYLVDLNATQAAIRTGYSAKTARQQGQRLLTNVDIRKKIQAAMDRSAERTGCSIQRVVDELTAIGFSNIKDYLTVDADGVSTISIEKLTPAQMAAIRDLKIETDTNGTRTIRVKLADKLGALIQLARRLELDLAAPPRQTPPPSAPRHDIVP